MATIVLTAVGSIVGGPIGAAIGAVIGQQIDNRVFAPPGRKGPRLNELAVQTSSYGSAIPKLFGVNRMSGTVIWATDLRETKKKVSNGKGQPKSTVFSYSASFAVLLSGRPILRVERIWADGNLLRGAAGDFKTQTGFRLYTGDERQQVDPLIASVQGAAQTPAYRGLAYAVFEDFQLGEYGNRIPSLSFEVVADDGPVSLGFVAEELSEGAAAADWPLALGGIAATGDSLRGLVETFVPLAPASVREDGGRLRIENAPRATTALAAKDLGASSAGERHPPLERERKAIGAEPRSIAVAHYEPARDYQQGLQRVSNPGGRGREMRLDLPATASGDIVKAYASAAATRSFRERATATVRLPWRQPDIVPGDAVTIPGEPHLWRIETLGFEAMTLVAQLRAYAPDQTMPLPADGGAGVLQTDLLHGATSFELLDLPPLDATVASGARIAVAAAGASPGWRSAALLVSSNGGLSWDEAGATASPAVIGASLTALGNAAPQISDTRNSVEIELLADAMVLHDADEAALDAGANMAMLGDELVQFGTATPIGARRYRLAGLLRGRRGSEWAMATHLTGERFVLLEGQSLATIAVPPGASSISVMAVGVGDSVPPAKNLAITGEAARPPSVAHLRAERGANGDTQLRWIRRSRNGWAWLDAVDAPLVEEAERYRVTLAFDNGASRSAETSVCEYTYAAAQRAADLSAGASVATISVVQLGALAASRPTLSTIALT